MNVLFKLAIVPISLISYCVPMPAQSRPVFPQEEGITMSYVHYDGNGEYDADFSISLLNVKGTMENGGLDMVYKRFDKAGNPYFDGGNEFLMIVERINGQTFITMDKMSKTMKIMNLISAGDVSSINVPMKVGESLPDTQIFSTLGIFKATLTISEKKVLDHKTMIIDGIEYDCWLVHEKILTKTPFSTDTATADTWYAEGAGCISQTVYNAKGKLKGKLELKSIDKK